MLPELSRDAVIALAKNCGVEFAALYPGSKGDFISKITIADLVKIINTVSKVTSKDAVYDERERCARIAESCKSGNELCNLIVEQIADQIRHP